jgi:hypothetical protein
MRKLQFLTKKDKFFSAVFFLNYLVIKTLGPDLDPTPEPDSDSLEMLDPDPDSLDSGPQQAAIQKEILLTKKYLTLLSL